MIIVALSGGIGNQMFQYAYAYCLSELNQVELKLDLSYYPKQKLRDFELFKIIPDLKIASEEEIKKIRKEQSFFSIGIRKIKSLVFPFYKRNIISQEFFEFKKEYLLVKSPVYLEGYWQSEKFFMPVKDKLINLLQRKFDFSDYAHVIKEEMEKTVSVALHVRRGDYVTDPETNKAHGVMPVSYYGNGVKLLKEKTLEEFVFFVFSDDIQWCKENLHHLGKVFYVDKTIHALEDLYLMTFAKHHIISNGSFAWWGAYLNPKQDKIVAAPKNWFAGRKDNTVDLIPESWIRI